MHSMKFADSRKNYKKWSLAGKLDKNSIRLQKIRDQTLRGDRDPFPLSRKNNKLEGDAFQIVRVCDFISK